VKKSEPFLVLGLTLGALLLGATSAALAQVPAEQSLEQFLEAVRGDFWARRDSAMRELIQVDEDKAEAFWALKQAYDEELSRLAVLRLDLLRSYSRVADRLDEATANRLADEAFDLLEQRLALQRKYFKRMSKEISPVVAVQFLQLDHQFQAMADLKLQSVVPLAIR